MGFLRLRLAAPFHFRAIATNCAFGWRRAGSTQRADLRLVVLPPPYMVESLKAGEVDGFCVGAPWNFVAAEQGLGHTLHYGCEIVERLTEKVLAVRCDWAWRYESVLMRLMSAVSAAAMFACRP